MTADACRQRLAAGLLELHQQHAALARQAMQQALASTRSAVLARGAIEQATLDLQQVVDSANLLDALTRDIIAAVRQVQGAALDDVERSAAQVQAMVAKNVAAMADAQSAAFALQRLATTAILLAGVFNIDEYCALPAILPVAS